MYSRERSSRSRHHAMYVRKEGAPAWETIRFRRGGRAGRAAGLKRSGRGVSVVRRAVNVCNLVRPRQLSAQHSTRLLQ